MSAVPIPPAVINWNILNEIVSMDEDDPGFSQQLISQYLEQAETTFGQIEEELEAKPSDLNKLSTLGHFLKGSSASLGLQRIAWTCERIQDYGKRGGGSVSSGLPDSHYAELISQTLSIARKEFQTAKDELNKYYNAQL